VVVWRVLFFLFGGGGVCGGVGGGVFGVCGSPPLQTRHLTFSCGAQDAA